MRILWLLYFIIFPFKKLLDFKASPLFFFNKFLCRFTKIMNKIKIIIIMRFCSYIYRFISISISIAIYKIIRKSMKAPYCNIRLISSYNRFNLRCVTSIECYSLFLWESFCQRSIYYHNAISYCHYDAHNLNISLRTHQIFAHLKIYLHLNNYLNE